MGDFVLRDGINRSNAGRGCGWCEHPDVSECIEEGPSDARAMDARSICCWRSIHCKEVEGMGGLREAGTSRRRSGFRKEGSCTTPVRVGTQLRSDELSVHWSKL